MNNIHTTDEQRNPMTDTAQRMKAVMIDALREYEKEKRQTGRSIAQAIWHGITVAQSEIWKYMGWK
jgi:hypothetical protein